MKKPLSALAFDYGLKNIGAAFGQTLTGTSQTLPALKARDGIPNWQALEELLKAWQPDIVVIGWPLNMDGSESELCARVLKFGRRLEGRFGVTVEYQDERLSSFEAKEIAREAGHKGNYGESPIDSLAAEVILTHWLRQQSEALSD